MVRRQFLTPPTLPETTASRCLVIPNSREWLGIFNAALLATAQAFNYEQVNETDLTADEVSAICYEIYEQYLMGECAVNCNDSFGCLSPYLRPATAATYRVEDDVPQISFDGGTTWSDLPSDDGTARTPPLTVTPGASDDAKLCLASSRAVITLAALYQQTAGAVAADLMGTLNAINNLLYQINYTIASVVYGEATSVLKAFGWDALDLPTEFSDPTLSEEQQDALTCLLLDNASVANGIVTFNFNGVYDNVIATLGLNPGVAVNLLLSYLGGDGLNRAGNVENTDTADCDGCDMWCHEFDFTVDNGGFSVISGNGGVYTAGVGWQTTLLAVGTNRYRQMGINRALSAALIKVTATFTWTRGFVSFTTESAYTLRSGLAFGGTVLRNVTLATDPVSPDVWTGEVSATGLSIQLMPGNRTGGIDPGGSATLTKLKVEGTGTNPFGTSNC